MREANFLKSGKLIKSKDNSLPILNGDLRRFNEDK